jgi:dienelactone hydrolase
MAHWPPQTPAKPGVVRAISWSSTARPTAWSPQQVEAFKAEMDAAKVNYQFVSIEGAKHGFTNPDADRLSHGEHGGPDIGYNKAADESSWADMQAFFKKVFK